MNLYKKCNEKLYSFLVIDTTLASDNPLGFRKNPLKRMLKPAMKNDDKIIDEKLENDINKEAAKMPALSSDKIVNI